MTAEQNSFPKNLDPFLTEFFGEVIQSQLIGDNHKKRGSNRVYKYANILLTEKNVVSLIRRILMESSYKTIAMNDGSVMFKMILSRAFTAFENGKEVSKVNPIEMFTEFKMESS